MVIGTLWRFSMSDAKANQDQASGPSPRLDDWVSKVVIDPKQTPATVVLFGYLGASSEADAIRLYFDVQLSDWIEIPNSSILYSLALDTAQSPLGGSLVWISRDALVVFPVGAGQLKAKFLEGEIQRDYLAGRLPGACGSPTPGTPRCPTPGTPLCPSPGGFTPGTPRCPSPGGTTPGTPHCPSPCGTTPGTPHCPSPCGTPGTPQCAPTPHNPC